MHAIGRPRASSDPAGRRTCPKLEEQASLSASVASSANNTRYYCIATRNMSDSQVPSDAAIIKQLHDVVISLHKAGNTDDLTVKRVRTRAEEKLGLDAGFLKSSDWKQKSQDAIMEAVVSVDISIECM